jgi:hypothetical protein
MNIKRIAQVLISVFLLAVIVSWIDLQQLSSILARVNPWYIVLALFIATINRILMSLKWNVLLNAKQIRLSWYEVTKIYYTATFLGIVLPSTVGSDVIKAYRVSRSGFRLADVVTSIVVERLLGLIALLLFGSVGVLIFVTRYSGTDTQSIRLIYVAVTLMLIVGGVFLISLSTTFGSVLYRVLGRYQGAGLLARGTRQLEKLYESYQHYSRNRGALVLFFALTCVENVLPIIRAYVVAIALNHHVPLDYLFVVVPIALMLIRLPISFDGFGIREGVFVYFLTLIGMGPDVAFTIGLTNHLLFLVAVLPGGVFYVTDGKYREEKAKLARRSVVP